MRTDSKTLVSLRKNSKCKRVATPNIRDVPQASRGAALRRRLEDRFDRSPDLDEVGEEPQELVPPTKFTQEMIHWYHQAKELSESGVAGSCTFAQFIMTDPPKFDGKLDPLKADDWIRNMEGIFRAENVRDDQKVNFAT
ncbi:hypothetical protein ACJRO7_008577 [Eucalyptus globulus]|uniref:Uncharacterized protein n=1 Tax=Eucalyptus globulus TaxID=34317 RepID=A0ABD3IRG3_EUCGL